MVKGQNKIPLLTLNGILLNITMQTLPVAYKPSNDIISNSNITKILNKFNLSYEEFLEKSIKDPEWFWIEFFNDINFKWLKFPDKIVEFF